MKPKLAVYHNLPEGGGKRAMDEHIRGLMDSFDITVYSHASSCNRYSDDIRRSVAVKIFGSVDLNHPVFSRYEFLLGFVRLILLYAASRRMAREIRANAPQAVLVQNCYTLQAPFILRMLGGLNTVFYCAEPIRRFYEKRRAVQTTGFYKKIIRPVLMMPFNAVLKGCEQSNARQAEVILVNSRYSKKTIDCVYRVSSHVCYLGVDLHRFKPIPEVEKKNVVISVGSLDPSKGHHDIINALQGIPAGVRPELVVVANRGSVTYRARLTVVAAESGVTLRIIERISDSDLVILYNEAVCTVCAAYNEPFGFVPIESTAAGTPVVAVPEGGYLESVEDGVNGILAPRNTLGTALLRLLNDRGTRDELGRRGRALAEEKWSWQRSVANVRSYLEAG